MEERISGRKCPSPPCKHAPKCSALISPFVRDHLLACTPRLSEYLYLDERFFNHLTSFNIINRHDKERIQGDGPSKDSQVHELMRSVLRKPWSYLRAFCRFCYSYPDEYGYIIREVLGLDQDAAFIAPTNHSPSPGPSRDEAVNAASFNTNQTEPSIDENLAQVQQYLHRLYRQQYRTFQVLDNQVINMYQFHLPVLLSTSDHSGLNASNDLVEEETIFDPANVESQHCDSYDRVLILGHTGSGKTTMCYHTAANWAKNSTDDYKLVLHLNSASVIKYGIKRTLLGMLPRQGNLKKTLVEYLEAGGKKCLFILDDIDLIMLHGTDEAKDQVQELISGDLFTGARLLATAKVGLSQDLLYKFERALKLKGLSEKQVHKFVSNYFKETPDKKRILIEFLETQEGDHQTLEELTQKPLWLLILCRVWELKLRVNSDLTFTKLCVCFERYRVKHKTGRAISTKALQQLYRTCLHCVISKEFLLNREDLSHLDKTSIVFDFFLKRSYVTEDFEEAFGYILPQRSLLLFFAAREVSEMQSDWQSVWILLNILLGDEESADIAPFLAGLLQIPNMLDLLLLHELFRSSVDLSSLKSSDCISAMTQAKEMVKRLIKECRDCLGNPNRRTIGLDCVLSEKKVRRQSFATDLQNKASLVNRIKQMVTDVLHGICAKCLANLFHHVLQRYHKIVALLRCQYEGMTGKDGVTSLIFAKLNRHHPKCIYVGTAKNSPYNFLISELKKSKKHLTVKLPYARDLPHLQLLVSYLREIFRDRLQLNTLKILLGMGSENIERKVRDTNSSKSDLKKAIKDCLSKLYTSGLSKVSIHGFDPAISASLLPTHHPETLNAVTIGYLSQTNSWHKALSYFSNIRVDQLRFKSLEIDMNGIVHCLIDENDAYENVGSFQVGHKCSLELEDFHRLLLETEVSVRLEHPTIKGLMFREVMLVYHPVESCRDVYLSFAEDLGEMPQIIPPGLELNNLRIADIYTRVNLTSVLQGLAQEGVRVSDLQISHTYMSGFILEELSQYKEELHDHVENITVKFGTYQSNEITEFLLCQNFTLSCFGELCLDSPNIDRSSLHSIVLRHDSEHLRIHLRYNSGCSFYKQLLPSIHLGSLAVTGLSLDQNNILEDLHEDVSKCQVEKLVFHFDQYMPGDACVQNIQENMITWQEKVSSLVLRNCCLWTSDMCDLIALAEIIPLSFESVQMGTIQFHQLHIGNDPLSLDIGCRYPQDFTDLLPTTHQIFHLNLKFISDYDHNVSVERNDRSPPSAWGIFKTDSSPSSVPRTKPVLTKSKRTRRKKKSDENSYTNHSSPKSNDSFRSRSSSISKRHSSPKSNGSFRSRSSSISRRRLSITDSEHSMNASFGSVHRSSYGSEVSEIQQRSPLHEIQIDNDNSHSPGMGSDPNRDSPSQCHSLYSSLAVGTSLLSNGCRGSSQHSNNGNSKQSNSAHGSSVKTDGSGRTQTDGSHSLMLELEKSWIAEVCFDLSESSVETCEDIFQALIERQDMLRLRMTKLTVKHPPLPSQTISNYSQTLIGLQTKLVPQD